MTEAGAASVSPAPPVAPSPLELVRAWLERQGAGTVFISNPVSVGYLTGFLTEPHERLLALILSRSQAVLVVPSLEEESALATARGVTVRAWRDGSDPWQEVAAVFGESGAGRLAVEKGDLRLAAWERLQAITGARTPLDVGPQVRAMRARKRPDELVRLEEAARITDAVAERAVAGAAAGRGELEMATEIGLGVAEAGAQLSFETIVQSGPNSALPHSRPGARQVRSGELLLIDFGAAWGGYKADITRTVVVGRADMRQRAVHETVLRAHDAAVAAVRAGVTAGDVDRAAREVIDAAGLGEFFIHRTGHGLGLEAHEDPSLDPGSATVLESGMVVTVEPGVYVPGWGGVRIEDDVVVEEGGCRLLTSAGRGLEHA
jgi:Xaa-Pro aminopeptidase